MKTKVLKVLAPTLLASIIIGCGGSSHKSSQKVSSEPVSIKGLQDLSKSMYPQKFSTKSVKNIGKSYKGSQTNDGRDKLCSQGGSMTFSENSLTANSCKEDGLFLDGKINLDQSSQDSGTISVDRDITIKVEDQGAQNSVIVKKGSSVVISKAYATIDMKMRVNGKTLDINDIKLTINNEKRSLRFNSGTVQIDKYTFIVVKQITDFKSDENGNVTGLLELKDGAGHKIELQAQDQELVLKVDENGDGTFSDSEKLELEDLFDGFLNK